MHLANSLYDILSMGLNYSWQCREWLQLQPYSPSPLIPYCPTLFLGHSMRCLSLEFRITIATEARVECNDGLITGKSQLIGEGEEREGGMWGLAFDTTTIDGTNWSRSSIMETMPHCCRCPSRKQSLAMCSNSESDSDSHCESNCDYPESLSQSTVLRYYCRYFCPCSPCCRRCCCCCCYPCYPCCCPGRLRCDCFQKWNKDGVGDSRLAPMVTPQWQGVGDGASLGHTSSCRSLASLSLCPVLGNKSRKNCGLQSRISIAQLFIIASALPPGALCSAFPLLCSFLLFFFSSDTFTLPFGHLSPLWPFSPATSGHPSDTGHGDVFISCSSFISFCSFFFCFCFVLFLFLFHTSENICICARLLHVLPLSPPLSFVSFTPTPSPTLPTTISFLLPLLSLPPFLRPLHLLPFGPRLLFYFVLICVFVCFVLCFAVLFIFDSFSPRFSNLLICELLCSHYNSFSSVSLPLLLPIRWEFKRTTPPPLSAWRLTGVLWIPFNCEMRREIKIFFE